MKIPGQRYKSLYFSHFFSGNAIRFPYLEAQQKRAKIPIRRVNMQPSDRSRISTILHRFLSWIKRGVRKEPEPPGYPGDPYAYVTAPKKPRPSGRSAAAVAELPEE
jgi:hypothetical protein